MSEDGSVTHWIHQLKAGDSDAAHQLLGRYYRRLIALAKKLRGSRRAADEEDVVQNAFAAFCRRARLGQFARLDDRNDLLRLLLVITARKAIDQRMKENCGKRGRGAVRGDSAFRKAAADESTAGWEGIVGTEPTPEFAAQAEEEYERLLRMLPDDEVRTIAAWKMEGCTNDEIAGRIGRSVPTVERRLRLIRRTWEKEIGPDAASPDGRRG